MSFSLDGNEQSIAENLGSLDGYLGERQYTTGQVAMNGETVVRNDFAPGAAYPQQPGYAPQGMAPAYAPPAYQGPQQPSGVSREQFDAAITYAQQMEQAAQVAAQQAIIAEENQFLANLDYNVEMGYITPVQRDLYVALKRNEQLETSHMTMAQRIQAQADEQEEEEQIAAKVKVSFKEAMNHGVNWFNADIRNVIMEAEDLEDMRSRLRVLRMYPGAVLTPPAGQQQYQQQYSPSQVGAYAAANGRGRGAPPAQMRRNTGDLGGYIRSKGGYQSIAVE